MSSVPWWYSVVRGWRWRALVQTHYWLPDIPLTLDVAAPSSTSAIDAPPHTARTRQPVEWAESTGAPSMAR